MATEDLQSQKLDQKAVHMVTHGDEHGDEMVVDKPDASPNFNGHAKSDDAKPEPAGSPAGSPATNGNAEPTKESTEAAPESDSQSQEVKKADSVPPEQPPKVSPEPTPAEEATTEEATAEEAPAGEAPAGDTDMKSVNGHADEPAGGDVPMDGATPAAAEASEPEPVKDNDEKVDAKPEPAADDAMEIDVPTKQPEAAPGTDTAQNAQDSVMNDAPESSPRMHNHTAELSRLDIKGTQEDEVPTPKTDAPATDLPASPTKISREREEDLSDEPLAKRPKTVSQVETAQDSIGVATAPSQGTPGETETAGSAVDLQIPEERPITPFQNKELRAKIGNVKKTKSGGNFKQSVEKLWPDLWNNYKALIDKPVDLSMLEQGLRENRYANYGELKADVQLLFENANKFNGTGHIVTNAASQVTESLLRIMADVSKMEEPVKEKGRSQTFRHAEPRATNLPRRQSQSQPKRPAAVAIPKPKEPVAAPTAPPTPASATSTSPAFALPPNGVPQIRRDSTRDDGDRPKRPINPPKNRDLDYPAKGNRKKKLEPEMKFFDEVLRELKKPRHYYQNQWFMQPVDPVAMNIPTYFSVIKKPMDLSKMTDKLDNGVYKNSKELEKDMKQIVDNTETFNGHDSEISKAGRELLRIFKDKMAEKDAWMARYYPSALSPAAAGSPEPDAHESFEESEAEPEEEDNNQIRTLSARIAEEQDKLATLMSSKKPDLVMLEVQQSVINVLQRKMVEERAKLNDVKKSKPKKKAAKTKSKPGAAGAASNHSKKPSIGSAINKKTAPVKKSAVPKRKLVDALGKAVIADGINELDGPLLNKAVEIIKRDTNQKEDDDGQLELDIEVLSQDALGKLHDLVTKAMPHLQRDVAARQDDVKQEEPEEPRGKANNGSGPSKPKKNKPMNKHEQEANIEKLRELKAQFQRHGSGSQEPIPTGGDDGAGDSSEESDSEEE